jgi:hypothetical protein
LSEPRGGAPGGPGGDRDDGDPGRPPTPSRLAVDDVDAVVASLRVRGAKLVGEVEKYEDVYHLCYVRGPEAMVVELAEQIG